jgi:uncharacterized repeat protein (TIGR03803 family)
VFEDASGDLFGTASAGSTDNLGTVFELARGSSAITDLDSFTDPYGQGPVGGLARDGSGNLYGVTSTGGLYNDGTIFELQSGSSTITTLASFDDSSGSEPGGRLFEDSSGNLFGTIQDGGAADDGTIFELQSGSNTITALASFDNNTDYTAQTGVIEDTNGNFFGAASNGANDDGSLFELAKGSSTITTLASFNGTNGSGHVHFHAGRPGQPQPHRSAGYGRHPVAHGDGPQHGSAGRSGDQRRSGVAARYPSADRPGVDRHHAEQRDQPGDQCRGNQHGRFRR